MERGGGPGVVRGVCTVFRVSCKLFALHSGSGAAASTNEAGSSSVGMSEKEESIAPPAQPRPGQLWRRCATASSSCTWHSAFQRCLGLCLKDRRPLISKGGARDEAIRRKPVGARGKFEGRLAAGSSPAIVLRGRAAKTWGDGSRGQVQLQDASTLCISRAAGKANRQLCCRPVR